MGPLALHRGISPIVGGQRFHPGIVESRRR